MPTDDTLAAVTTAADRYNTLADARLALQQAVVAALADGHAPKTVQLASTRDREQVRRWARRAGLPPVTRGGRRDT